MPAGADMGVPIEVLSGFVKAELLRLSGVTVADTPCLDPNSLDHFFCGQLA